MRFLSIYTPDATTTAQPPSEQKMAAMGKLIEEMTKAGTLITTGGLLPLSQGGVQVRATNGASTVMDGPFTESKELICGFAILRYATQAEAIEGTRHFLAIAGDGKCELRQIIEDAE